MNRTMVGRMGATSRVPDQIVYKAETQPPPTNKIECEGGSNVASARRGVYADAGQDGEKW